MPATHVAEVAGTGVFTVLPVNNGTGTPPHGSADLSAGAGTLVTMTAADTSSWAMLAALGNTEAIMRGWTLDEGHDLPPMGPRTVLADEVLHYTNRFWHDEAGPARGTVHGYVISASVIDGTPERYIVVTGMFVYMTGCGTHPPRHTPGAVSGPTPRTYPTAADASTALAELFATARAGHVSWLWCWDRKPGCPLTP